MLAVPFLLAAFVSSTGCASQSDVEPDKQVIPTTPVSSVRPTDAVKEETPPTDVPKAPEFPPVQYESAWPDRTVLSDKGYPVNSCVPEELRSHATTLKTSDDIYLSALVLGSGSDGILLDHEQGYSICSFLDIGTELAEQGYLVVLPEYRAHGASQKTENMKSIDLDAEAALNELARQGAKRVFLAGASCGGTTAIISGVRQPLPIQGLLILSSPAQCGQLDAIPSIKELKAPSLFVVSPGDMNGAVEKQVRQLYEASGSDQKELLIDESGFHGTDMYKSGEYGDKLRTRIVNFINAAFH
ncbi:lysophospholipase [Cohnella terricola]|uniref:Lysophospholipase n=2 Tax=Cohnella terricola TaxID=1289167 RepID=A0A559JXL7_9BACL|nr:lysophospholipase [Cohnella terricola]